MSASKKPESFVQRIMLSIDTHTSVKLLIGMWGPRLEFVVRLMLVATFFDDSFRVATHFPAHVKAISEEGYLNWLAETSPGLVSFIVTILLGMGILAQCLSSMCLLALPTPVVSTTVLIGWAILQPVLYAQLSNMEMVANSLSLIGGLIMLRAHFISKQGEDAARMSLVGRLLLPVVYLYHAGVFLSSAYAFDETNSIAMYISKFSMFIVNIAVLVGLVIGSMFVAAGLKSRAISLLLALLNLGYISYQHPFFLYSWLEHWEWKYSQNIPLSSVALQPGVNWGDLDPYELYDLHRYYFFLGLSASGALLLLTQFGPGKIAVQENEPLLPVVLKNLD